VEQPRLAVGTLVLSFLSEKHYYIKGKSKRAVYCLPKKSIPAATGIEHGTHSALYFLQGAYFLQ
jgi:hypothetical protein